MWRISGVEGVGGSRDSDRLYCRDKYGISRWALYAIGYDAHTMDSLVRRQDWTFLLSDKVYRYNLPFSEKEETEKYLVSVPIKNNREIKIPSGFISGQNIYNLFSDLTIGYHDSLDFKKLPIPFCLRGE